MSKFALLIGINYNNTVNKLFGCINDIIMTRKHLIEKCGYNDNNITVLLQIRLRAPVAPNHCARFMSTKLS
jgi:hypothetical protein